MKWFLVRFKDRGIGYALHTREQAKRLRDMSGSKKATIEVIPAKAITDMLKEWDAMAKKNEFEGGPLTDGEVAVIKAMRQDLQERLASL